MHIDMPSNTEPLYGMLPPDSGFISLDLPPEWSQPNGMQIETEVSSSSSNNSIQSRTDSHHAPDERSIPPGSPCTRGQNCLADLSELALDLHIPNDHSCTTSNSSLPGSLTAALHTPASSDNVSFPLGVDAVLLQNRTALSRLSQTLDCPCSSDLSVTLAAYLVASKIVAWYGAILGIDDNSNNSSVLSEGESFRTANNSSRIVGRPILMGTYSLDAKVHASIRARVVVSELSGCVEPLLAKLPHFKQSMSASFVEEQRCNLRDHVRRIVAEANRLVMR